MTTTQTPPTLADLIPAVEKLLAANPAPEDFCEDEPEVRFPQNLTTLIQQMKAWPVESITERIHKSFDDLIKMIDLVLAKDHFLSINKANRYLELYVEHVLPVLIKGDGLEARLQIAKSLTIDFIEEFEGADYLIPIEAFDPFEHYLWVFLKFGIEDQLRDELSPLVIKASDDASEEHLFRKRINEMKFNERYLVHKFSQSVTDHSREVVQLMLADDKKSLQRLFDRATTDEQRSEVQGLIELFDTIG